MDHPALSKPASISNPLPGGGVQKALVLVSLQTPSQRLAVWVLVSAAIYLSPARWLEHLSIWQRLGWDWAPSIGLTRAYRLLLHGQPMAAYQRNPLIYVVIAIGGVLLMLDVRRLLFGAGRKT